MTRYADGREKHLFKLDEARALAGQVVGLLAPYVDKILIVGSIRRELALVADIDIVAIPKCEMRETWFSPKSVNILHERVAELIRGGSFLPRVKKDGKTMIGEGVAFVEYKGIPLDIYYATPETWGGLVLIRTGSTQHNIMMVTKAKDRGWFLHASGEGLFDKREGGTRIDANTEASFFELLGIPWREPGEREVR